MSRSLLLQLNTKVNHISRRSEIFTFGAHTCLTKPGREKKLISMVTKLTSRRPIKNCSVPIRCHRRSYPQWTRGRGTWNERGKTQWIVYKLVLITCFPVFLFLSNLTIAEKVTSLTEHTASRLRTAAADGEGGLYL